MSDLASTDMTQQNMQRMQRIRVTDQGGNYLTLHDIDGRLFPQIVKEENIRSIVDLNIRDDDVFICGMPRSGHHWVYGIVSMLLRDNAETVQRSMEKTVLELVSLPDLDAITSPRVMATHMCYRYLPPVKQRKVPLIHLVRDPRDVSVSWFNLYRAWPGDSYQGKFSDWLELFSNGKLPWGSWFDHTKDWGKVLTENPDLRALRLHYEDMKSCYKYAVCSFEVPWGSWFDHTKNWEKVLTENPDLRALRIHYEDLKSDTLEVVKTLKKFLDVNASSALCKSIADKCQFEQMKKDNQTLSETWNGEMVHFRKGVAGDWKKWFTKEESENFNKLYETEMANTTFEFQYCQEHTND